MASKHNRSTNRSTHRTCNRFSSVSICTIIQGNLDQPCKFSGARLCAEHQPQHVGLSKAPEYIRRLVRAPAAAAAPADTVALLRLQLSALRLSAVELQFSVLLTKPLP